MKKLLTAFVFIATSLIGNSQTLYSKAYGNPQDKPLIFFHGGPGYNSVGFESTTAKRLSENGFYVIAYDRRGEGRSPDQNAKFNFDETFDDINSIYDQFNLTSATLMGHSFGGIVATLYAEKYPDKIKSIVLLSAPLAIQETLSTILKSSKSIYTINKDSVNLAYVSMLEKMDKSSLIYSSYCFAHAMQNGFYYPKASTKEALNIYSTFKTDSMLLKYSSEMTYEAPRGFWENEQYTTLNLKDNLKVMIQNGIPVFGLYGKDDGLFSKTQLKNIANIVDEANFKCMDNCSHNLFIDQQIQFINALKNWIE